MTIIPDQIQMHLNLLQFLLSYWLPCELFPPATKNTKIIINDCFILFHH